MKSEPLRVVQVLASFGYGGAERLVLDLAGSLDPRRVQVHVLALSKRQGAPLKAEFERLGIPVHLIGAHKMYNPRVIRELDRMIRSWGIELIHTHLMMPDVLGRIVGAWRRLPVVSTLHNIPAEYEKDAFYRYWFQRATISACRPHLIAVSERIRGMYMQRWGVPERQITTIINGVPLARFVHVPPGVPPRAAGEGPLISTVGRLSEQKGQQVLLNAAPLVLKQFPTARFQIVGQGHLEGALREQAATLGIADRVHFAGMRDDIPALLGESDIFALPSLWEGLPISAIEAMAAARPVVLTDVGGVGDLVNPGVDGMIVPPNDPVRLADAMNALLADPTRRAAMGANARKRACAEFDIALFTARHEQLYRELAGRKAFAEQPSVAP